MRLLVAEDDAALRARLAAALADAGFAVDAVAEGLGNRGTSRATVSCATSKGTWWGIVRFAQRQWTLPTQPWRTRMSATGRSSQRILEQTTKAHGSWTQVAPRT